MAELQRILLDKPISPLDTALWWVDYVLRYNDTSHLRAASFNQWWYQRRLIDVYFFLFIIAVLTAALFMGILLFVGKKIFSGKSIDEGEKIKIN